jgi:hypothetical protein
MRAKAGDKLLAGSGSVAIIINVLGSDGHPPYIVRWLPAGNIAMIDPDPYARAIPADSTPPRYEVPGPNSGPVAGQVIGRDGDDHPGQKRRDE